MTTYRDRTCIVCGDTEYHTATRSDTCIKCHAEAKANIQIDKDRAILENLGYENISVVGINKIGKREWKFTHADCGTEQIWVFRNIAKRIQIDPNTVPCTLCGSKRRMTKAMDAYVAKYGITPEQLAELNRYTKKVRGLTTATYKLHENEINPLKLKRGQGPDDYHLDHIVTIHYGFHNGLPPEFIARKENLQMLTSFENLSKGRK